ncbi:unnamed protein product [Discula destructiva]
MASAGGALAPVVRRLLRQAVVSSAKVLQGKLSQPLANQVQHVAVRATVSARQPIHPLAILRQCTRRARWSSSISHNRLSTAVRRLVTTAGHSGRVGPTIDRTAFTRTTLSRAIAQFPGRAPFAHTLRPNLTCGALGRTSGGYAVGSGRIGGQRFFSHAPASQAHVVQNVSQAMRAFWLSGQRAHFDGYGANGEKTYRPVSSLHESSVGKMASMQHTTPGSFIDFTITPPVTALSPLVAPAAMTANVACGANPEVAAATLNTEGFLDVLATDFARQLKALTAVMADLKRLADLGDLPITLEKKGTLRVRFPGLDAETVERLCDDVGVQRGIVKQDPGFSDGYGIPMALQFPHAPDATEGAHTCPSPGGALRSHRSDLSSFEDHEALFDEIMQDNPWLSTPPAEADPEDGYANMCRPDINSAEHVSEDLEGLEGIHRFLEECDYLKSRL